MTTAHDPSHVPDDPAVQEARASLAKTQRSGERLAGALTRLDVALVAVVLLLAFLLASFTVRNTDFWLHLAAGRLLAQGHYTFGSDPFTYTSGPAYWVNHAWLFDLLLYLTAAVTGGAESALAGAVLVVLKALAVTALAAVMLGIRRPGQSMWPAAVSTGLALLAMSPRLHFQPSTVSLLFLGLTLFLLYWPQYQRDKAKALGRPVETDRSPPFAFGLSPFVFLVPLFVLWVNVDSWFLLGPVTVYLYLLGEWLQRAFPAPGAESDPGPTQRELRQLGLVCILGLAACMLNPHHVHAFLALPTELAGLSLDPAFSSDNQLNVFYLAPLVEVQQGRYVYFQRLETGWAAFALLLAVGLVSFVLNLRHYQWWRLLLALALAVAVVACWQWSVWWPWQLSLLLAFAAVAAFQRRFVWRPLLWLAFAALAACQQRFVPFFAVVAGPITALNLQDVAARFAPRAEATRGWLLWGLGGRVVTLLAGLALLVTAWTGWVQGRAENPRLHRRVAWRVEVDPSLQAAAQQLCAWRGENLLAGDAHGFPYSLDVAHYCAWFCPEEKGFLDVRFPLSLEATKTFVQVRRALLADPRDAASARFLEEVFQKYHINHLILHSVDPAASAVTFALRGNSDKWTLLYQDGRTDIFLWNVAGPSPLQERRPDFHRLAFGPTPSTAPRQGLLPVEPRDPWERFWAWPYPSSLDGELVHKYIDIFYVQERQRQQVAARRTALESLAVLGCVPVPAGALVPTPLTLAWLVGDARRTGRVADESVPAPLASAWLGAIDRLLKQAGRIPDVSWGTTAPALLAVRAGRRAVATNPEDADAYFGLVKAYDILWKLQEDRWTARRLPTDEELIRQFRIQPPWPWGDRPPPLPLNWVQSLRLFQLLTALQQAQKLRPDSSLLHFLLARTYLMVPSHPYPLPSIPYPYDEWAMEHLTRAKELAQAAGPAEQTRLKEITDFETAYADVPKLLKRQRDDFELRALGKAAMDKAALAFQRGLSQVALEELEKAKPAERGLHGNLWYLYLLLVRGRVDILRQMQQEYGKQLLPGTDGIWLNAMVAAACGDYGEADQELGQFITDFRQEETKRFVALMGGTLAETPQPFPLTYQVAGWFLRVPQFQSLPQLPLRWGAAETLRGLLTLEEGNTAAAAQHFREAEAVLGPRSPSEARPVAAHYLQDLEVWRN
jgi:tetratricopeptide (TPR) repeat protein